MQPDTERFILAMLQAHNILTLATVREDGYPQATTVGYVHEGPTLYIGTFTQAQKVANIRRCPKVSLTIDKDYDDWSQIKGLSMGGTAEILTDPEAIARAAALFTAKFPQIAALPVPIDPATVVFMKITPRVISVLDYTQGFGHTELVSLDA
jgi:nitroimidazol reductase NimA-like FMN-containing flavoprotein (pyridoxamine 5'-phosphate oxidase superfamily)